MQVIAYPSLYKSKKLANDPNWSVANIAYDTRIVQKTMECPTDPPPRLEA